MGGQVEAAKCIQPQPTAKTRFGKCPQGQWGGKLIGNSDRHAGICEGHLKDQHEIEMLRFQGFQRSQGCIGIKQQRLAANDVMAAIQQRLSGLCQQFFSKRYIEGRSAKRQYTNAGHVITL